jgi:DNA-binding NarL/FixJ family response regulator
MPAARITMRAAGRSRRPRRARPRHGPAVTELALARRRGPGGRTFAELTQREYDILDLIAQGLDNQTIARRLVLSPKTVRNHVSNVFTKLNVADRSHAIVLGRERGLGQGPD